jgi:Protein of unknown function (DUF3567)
MQMLYHSDSFAVMQFETPGREPGSSASGYEIVDKLARKEIFLQGALAERFRAGVQQLVQQGPSEEALDDFIAGFTAAAQQPLALH